MGRRTNGASRPAQPVAIHPKRLDLAKVQDALARLQHRRARMYADPITSRAEYFEDLADRLRSFEPVRIPGRLLSARFRVKNERVDYVLLADGRFKPVSASG